MTTGPRLTVVHATGERTAEGLAFVDLVAALAGGGDRAVDVVLFTGGPLVADLAEHVPTIVVGELDRWSPEALAERAAFAARRSAAGYRRRASRLGVADLGPDDAVYLHGVLGVQALRYLPGRGPGPSVLCRVAEHEVPLLHSVRGPDLALLVERVDRFLPVTAAGATELVDEHGVPAERVQRIRDLVVPVDERFPGADRSLADRRAELGIDEETVVLGSFGATSADPTDLTAVVWALLDGRPDVPPVELVWASARTEAGFWMEHDLHHLGVGGRAHALPVGASLDAALGVCDVAVLVTRAGHCPHRYLQAAASGVPVVCFEGNELAEVVAAGEGTNVVRFLDVATVADRVADIARSVRAGAVDAGAGALVEGVRRAYGAAAAAAAVEDAVAHVTGAAGVAARPGVPR